MAIGSTEHHATVEAAKLLIEDGWVIVDLSVDAEGVLDIETLDAALAQSPALVSLHWVNSETGVVHDADAIHACCVERGVPLHVDATQGVGTLALPILPELTTLAAHKFGGPKGIGALVVHDHVALAPLIPGTQEFDSRGGTENVALAIGMAKALELAVAEQSYHVATITPLARAFLNDLLSIEGVTLNGSCDQRMPTIMNLSLPGIRGDVLATALDMAGIACSTGSACSSGSATPSHVLLAMGRSEQEARQAIRLSMSPLIAEKELKEAVEIIRNTVKRLDK
jgi:cysteine desulfurase